MTSSTTDRLRYGAVLIALAAGVGTAAAQAQNIPPYGAGTVISPYREDASSKLARYIRTLASSPNDLSALLGAGNAAIEVGDMQAALAFFARAEEVAPRDGRVKAGMGSAFVQTEQPEAALKFFADAAALGTPIILFAKDRGLAYDMTGDPGRAQADYVLALRNGVDPEIERRLALSRAISGDRAGALAAIDAQLRRQDRAGWRTRAFVLALTGNTKEAVEAVEAAMPGTKASEMEPFLARLPQLSLAERAMAVHFGRFPRTTKVATASPPPPYDFPSANVAGRSDPGQTALGRTQAAQNPPRIELRTIPSPARQPASTGVLQSGPDIETPRSAQASTQGAAIITAELGPSEAAIVDPPPQTGVSASRINFADVAAAIAALPSTDGQQDVQPANAISAEKPKAALPKAAPAKPRPAKKAAPAPPKEPSRIWVQLAAGQNKKGFQVEFKRLQAKAPKLLEGKMAWTTPLKATNRLLVGPFKTDKEARDFVNALSKARISSYSWTSEAGQAIEKLSAR